MIDPMVNLAFAVYSNKGAYALLLGSGISRASGIPTGWEVVEDLIRKIAALKGEACVPDPAKWYQQKYGFEPDYSKLLNEVANTEAERQKLLCEYFEPTEKESSNGLKLPSAAHKAIAKLAKGGYLRIVITTNFDRLMEDALKAVGITPTVISTTDQLCGAMPLAHSGVTVIKLHGDYRDTRIKNTGQELATYDKPMDLLLDRIFDEYGLIVSGWSGDWDIALRKAIERCPSRRFTTFWSIRSQLSEKGKKLAEHRQAVTLQSHNADLFFNSLLEKVQSLDDMAARHPLTRKVAVATVKRYLVDPSAKIRLRDLVHEETERLFTEVMSDTPECLIDRIKRYEEQSTTLLSIFITGCYWGDEETTKLWVNSLKRLSNIDEPRHSQDFPKLRHYPTLILLYGASIASVSAGNYKTLRRLLTEPTLTVGHNNVEPLCSVCYPINFLNCTKQWKNLAGTDQLPVNTHLFNLLQEPFREYLPRNKDYEEAFDRFEYLFALVHADLKRQSKQSESDCWFGPPGLFIDRNAIQDVFKAELKNHDFNWQPLNAGFFDGSVERLNKAISNFNNHLNKTKSLPRIV